MHRHTSVLHLGLWRCGVLSGSGPALPCSDTPTKDYLPKFLSPSVLRSKLSKRSS